jgi:hypothetical protein
MLEKKLVSQGGNEIKKGFCTENFSSVALEIETQQAFYI